MPLHLKDVAGQAGVSTATASRVLRGVPGVSERTRTAVLAAVDALGYRRPEFAVPVARPVGVVTAARSSALLDPYGAVMDRLTARFAAEGLPTAIMPVAAERGADGEARAIDSLVSVGAGALVIATGRDLTRVDAAVRAYRGAVTGGTPIVVVGAEPVAEPPEWQRSLARMSVEGARAMDDCVKHLVSVGHRRIALTLPENADASGTAQGFRRAMASRLHIVGSRAEAPVSVSVDSVEAGAHTAGEQVDAGSTAIIAGSPALTFGALRAARERGLGVPDRLSVVGLGDIPGGDRLDPPLTVLRIPVDKIADAAADEIVRLLRAEPATPGRIALTAPDLVFHPELVVRASTSRPLRR